MSFPKYIPLNSISLIERWYPGIYSTLDGMSFEGKRELEVVNSVVSPFQKKLINQVLNKDLLTMKEKKKRFLSDFILILITKEWIHSKQVYSFSKEFLDILCDMDDYEINPELFNFLPFSSFYIEIPYYNQCHGVLVRYSPEEKMLYYCLCFKEGFGYYGGFEASALNLKQLIRFSDFAKINDEVAYDNKKLENYNIHKNVLCKVFQICMYLCSENADIVENEEQKKIYKPSIKVKNRYSEIRKWDVGFRVMHEHNKTKSDAEKEWQRKYSGFRQRPRMHWRKAHWHTYWCGEGRTIRRVKFIAPILVNSFADDEVPVVNRVQ